MGQKVTKIVVKICGLDELEKECRELLSLIEQIKETYARYEEAKDNVHQTQTTINP